MARTELVLRPNCLLTRRPLVFLTGRRSLFYYREPWSYIQYYLSEHGYKVEVLKLPFLNPEHRLRYLKNRTSQLSGQHIICDEITYLELKGVLDLIDHSTITVLTSKALNIEPHYSLTINNPIFSLSYWLHQKYLSLRGYPTVPAATLLFHPSKESLDQLLDHCVHLAEQDFYDLDLNLQT